MNFCKNKKIPHCANKVTGAIDFSTYLLVFIPEADSFRIPRQFYSPSCSLANMKSIRKAFHKNNDKTINCHHGCNSQRAFQY
ncbi:hypothetical protein EY052_18855 [Shigella flexneri]|nr:hypothetical protein [Shigella flexneri]